MTMGATNFACLATTPVATAQGLQHAPPALLLSTGL